MALNELGHIKIQLLAEKKSGLFCQDQGVEKMKGGFRE